MEVAEALLKITNVSTSHLRKILPGEFTFLYRYQRNSNEQLITKLGQLDAFSEDHDKRRHRDLPMCQPIVLEEMRTNNKTSNPFEDIAFE